MKQFLFLIFFSVSYSQYNTLEPEIRSREYSLLENGVIKFHVDLNTAPKWTSDLPNKNELSFVQLLLKVEYDISTQPIFGVCIKASPITHTGNWNQQCDYYIDVGPPYIIFNIEVRLMDSLYIALNGIENQLLFHLTADIIIPQSLSLTETLTAPIYLLYDRIFYIDLPTDDPMQPIIVKLFTDSNVESTHGGKYQFCTILGDATQGVQPFILQRGGRVGTFVDSQCVDKVQMSDDDGHIGMRLPVCGAKCPGRVYFYTMLSSYMLDGEAVMNIKMNYELESLSYNELCNTRHCIKKLFFPYRTLVGGLVGLIIIVVFMAVIFIRRKKKQELAADLYSIMKETDDLNEEEKIK